MRTLEDQNQAINRLDAQVKDLQTKLGRIGGGAWQTPTLLNSWGNFGSGLAEAAYRKEPAGVVRIRGVISGGTATALTVVFTLPSGFRPAAEEWFTVDTSGADPAQIRVQADGDVVINNASSTHLSLSGIAFHADA